MKKIKYFTYFNLILNSLSYAQPPTSFILKFKSGHEGLAAVFITTAGIGDAQINSSETPNVCTVNLDTPLNSQEITEKIAFLREEEGIEYVEENSPCYIDNPENHTLDKEKNKVHSPILSPTIRRTKTRERSHSTSSVLNISPNLSPEQQKNTQRYSLRSNQCLQWSRIAIKADLSSALSQGDPSVSIALIDTGVETSHKDLIDNFINGSRGYNIIKKKDEIDDLNGHGTHCAGILVGSGSKNICGIAPNCSLIPVKAMIDSNLNIQCSFTFFIAESIRYAADKGAKVINMSFTTPKDSQYMREAVEYAQSKGCLLVAAAGNNNTHQKQYPAAYEGVLSVGATGRNNKKLEQSNYGDWVSVCAPGEDIESTYINNTTKTMSGTSMACPHVAGLAALLFSLGGDNITAQEVKQIIEYNCNNLDDKNICKYGIIDAHRAIEDYCAQSNINLFSTISDIDTQLGNRKKSVVGLFNSKDESSSSIHKKKDKISHIESEAASEEEQNIHRIREELTFKISDAQIGKPGIIQVTLQADQSIEYKLSIYNVVKDIYEDLTQFKRYKQQYYDLTSPLSVVLISEILPKNNNYISSNKKLKIKFFAQRKVSLSLMGLLTKKKDKTAKFNVIISYSPYGVNNILDATSFYTVKKKSTASLPTLPKLTISLSESEKFQL